RSRRLSFAATASNIPVQRRIVFWRRAVDPHRGVIIANYNDMPNYDMLVTREDADAMGLFPAGGPGAAGSDSRADGACAQTGTPTASLSTRMADANPASSARVPLLAASALSISPPEDALGSPFGRPGVPVRSACPPSFRW